MKAILQFVRCAGVGATLMGWTCFPLEANPQSFTYGQQVVAAVLMGEAWGEGKTAMVAVAEVIRARAAATGRSPLAIVQVPYQFSCLNETTPRDLIRKFMRQPDFDVALQISRSLYNTPEKLPGIANGATHFERVGTGAPWAQGQDPVARIGQLNFYRLSDYARDPALVAE